MPDKIDELLKRLSGTKSIASSEASRNLNSQQFSRYNVSEAQEQEDAYAQEIKKQKAQRDEQLKLAGYKEEDIQKEAKKSEFWTDIFNSAKTVANEVIGASTSLFTLGDSQKEENFVFDPSSAKSVEQIKDEVATAYIQGKAFDRAIISNKVRNDEFGNYETLSDNTALMMEDDIFDNIKYGLGIEKDRFGNKKLKIAFNEDSEYFFYLDKDEEGNDILAKTRVKNYEQIKKTGKTVLNAYGTTPFEKGFARELGAGFANTYAGLAKNLVNLNRGLTNLASPVLPDSYVEGVTEASKEFNANYEIDQSQAGVGGTSEWLGAGIGQGASSLAQMAILGTTGRLLGSTIAPAASLTDKFNYLTNFGAGAILNYNEAYESALESGLSEDRAASVGLLTGAINGAIESVIGTNKLVNYLTGGGDRALARTVLRDLNGVVNESSINRVFNDIRKGLTGNPASVLNRLFEAKGVGMAAEEGLEELFQTFSQKGVENLYDLTLAGDKKVGEGRFGTEFFSKETLKEGLEAAFFGALLGGSIDISRTAMDKLSGRKHYSDNDIIPQIVDGNRENIEAIVKTLHNGRAISDQQKDFYLNRVEQLDKMYQANSGLFSTLDTFEDTEKASNLKGQALNLINNTFSVNKTIEDLSKKLNEVQSNPDLSETDKTSQTLDLTNQIKNNQLNAKFYNDYLQENFSVREDGTVKAYEDNYLNNEEIVQNKFARFAVTEENKKFDSYINKLNSEITDLETQLANPDPSVSPKEIQEQLDQKRNIALPTYESLKEENNKRLTDLTSEYNKITSVEYQNNLKNNITEEPEEEVTTTAPLEAVQEAQVESNINTQEDIQTAPISRKEALQQELDQINLTLENSEELDPQAIVDLSERVDDLNFELKNLDRNQAIVEKDYNDYLVDNNKRATAVAKLDDATAEPALSAIKKDIEQTIAGFNSNGIDTSALKQLHGTISGKLLEIRDRAKVIADEANRLAQETTEASTRDNQELISNINYFDRLHRVAFMNTSPEFYSDREVNDIFMNIPIEQILANISIVAATPEQLGYTVGQVVGQFNSTTQVIIPSIIPSIVYNGKKLGNIPQLDGFTIRDVADFNMNADSYNKTEARNIKINALLKERGELTPQDLQALGFNFNWNGTFVVNPDTPRVLVKDFPSAKLSENGNKPYIYDQVRQLEITEGSVDMRENPNVPPIPVDLKDRYVVLLRANNGKYYWAGSQNQVISDTAQNKLYSYLFKQVADLKAMSDPKEIKDKVSTINRYLSDNIFVSVPYAKLQLTTPNTTNKDYTLALKITGSKGRRVPLDAGKYGTMSDLLAALKLDKTNLRVPLADAAISKQAIESLSVNLAPTIIENPFIHRQLTFKFDEAKLNDFLVSAVPAEPIAEVIEDALEESDNPFADYTTEGSTDPTIEQTSKPETVFDLSIFDPSYSTLDQVARLQINVEATPLLENYDNLNKLQKKGVETKVRAIINKYRPSSGDPVFNISTAEELNDTPVTTEWLTNNLPSTVTVQDINTLLGNIKNNGTTFGAFANNVIYLNNNAPIGTQYHEAFHAVFRMFLSDKQIQIGYNLASKKYGKPTNKDIQDLRYSSNVFFNYSNDKLSELWLEEKMAEDFKSFAEAANKPSSGINALWNKILNFIRFVTGNMDEVQALFYNINRGKFKNATIQSNVFNNDFSNQDVVFSIFTKGIDENGNTITTTQLEGQGIVATLTNKYLNAKIANPRSDDNEILDSLIADKARFYSIDENPYYAEYLETKGLIDDDIYIDTMSRNLEQKRNIFTLPTNIAALKKDVLSKSKLFDLDEARNVEEQQAEVDDIGEQFERDVWTIGGETSFSKVLRQYISLVTIKTVDEYGQDIEEAVDFKKVYRGLVRALASTEEENILPRFKALAEFDEDINAVFNQLVSDLGLTNENVSIQAITKNNDLWRKFVTAFNNEKVAWYTILHSREQSRLIESNNASAKDVQFNEWLQNYSITFEDLGYNEELKKYINRNLDFINRSENTTVASFKEAKEKSNEIKQAFATVSIKLSNAYITYSLLKKSVYEELDQDGKDYLNSFAGTEGLYDGGNIPYIISEFKSDYNPFLTTYDAKNRERGAVTRIKSIAEQNALFDPTVGESSFQNADGKNIYSIIRPSFGLVKMRWLVDPVKRQEVLTDEKVNKDDFIDPLDTVKLNHILANENVDLIMKNLTPSMIDGYRQTTIEGDVIKLDEGEGVTFGKFDAKQYMLSDMLMFISNRKALNTIGENGKTNKLGESALFNINQMEASNTGYGVFLPVNNFKTVNNEAVDILFNYLAQEAIRIHKVKQNFGKGDTWIGYNDKQGARGFKLMEFAGYGIDELINDVTNDATSAQDVYNRLNQQKEFLSIAIKEKLSIDIEAYKQSLLANDIFDNLPKIELIKRGYLKENAPIDDKVINAITNDFYLNSYINTLGINNLLLDNYSKKVKNTVDWFKRAKGIIGSGPDMGTGVTKVAVYKEPVRFIDPKTLDDFDKDKLTSLKQQELEAEGRFTTNEISNFILEYRESLEGSEIKIADAQSYVTLDHRILQLQRWGRFPQQVSDVYEKIKQGKKITWEEVKTLEKNNAALNSTKTVAYNGDFYFKLSELILSPRLVGKTDDNGDVIFDSKGRVAQPKEGYEYLFNKYNAMLDQGVDQALPESASKMATIASAEFKEDGKFDFTKSIMTLENKFKRLQVETPSGKSKIIHGTQLIQLVHSEQDDSLEIDFRYNDEIKTLGDLRVYYRQLLADNRLEGFREAMAYMKDPTSGEYTSKELTKKFYNTIIESGSDEVLSNFFTPDHNGERQFNWNLGPIVNKAEQLFLAHFSKGVLSQKVPGLKVSLISDTGILIKDKKTGKMRSLAHMIKDDDGNYYSECLLPPFANELLGKDPSDKRIQEVLKMFGVRIPTQDKHSMIALKVVGFLPVEYGSVGVFPKEIVFLSGADFDIDSEFIHRKDFYTDKAGIPIPYGTATTNEDKYKEYVKWNLANNKLLAKKLKEIKSNDTITAEEAETLLIDGKSADIKSAFRSLNMPSTLEEFIEQKPINVGANNNAMLEAEIKFLTNDYVRNKAALIPASMDSIKSVAKVVANALNINTNVTVSPNTPLARFNANRNNMEGKAGIGPVALANVTHALLSTYNVQLFDKVSTPIISDKFSNGFSGIYTLDSKTDRKNDNISTLLSAMTDNAKEQLAKLLNLTFNGLPTDTLPVAAYMLALGYTMEETVLFLNQPGIRAYSTSDVILQDKLNHLAVGAKNAKLRIKPLTIEYLTQTLNEDNLELEDINVQLDILDQFSDLQQQARYTSNVSALLSLNKGLASTFSKNMNIENTLSDVQLSFILPYIEEDSITSYDQLIDKLIEDKIIRKSGSGTVRFIADENMPIFKFSKNINSTPFDARLALLSDPNVIQNVIIYKKVMDASKEFFLLNTDVFRSVRNLITTDVKELIPFFMDKAYKTYLEEVYPEKFESFNQAYENAGYMVHNSGANSIEKNLIDLKRNPNFRNNLLIKLLTLRKPTKGSAITQIEFPTRIKAEGDFYTNLNNAFKELFMNPQTREFARKLYYYSYFKDGLQFRNKSFINTIPTWVFKDVSISLDLLNDDFKDSNYQEYSSLKQGLTQTVIEMLTSFAGVDKLARKLPRLKINESRIVKQADNILTLKDADKLNFTSYLSYIKSIEDLIENNPKLKDYYTEFLKTDFGSIKYDLASYYIQTNEDPTDDREFVNSKVIKSIKGFDLTTSQPANFSLVELVDYYLTNKYLPIAYEVEYVSPTVLKEDGLNSTIVDTRFIQNIKAIKESATKEVTKEPEFVNIPFQEEVELTEEDLAPNLSIPSINNISQNNIYEKLGNKTASNNVVIKSVYQKEGIEFARSINGIFSLRVSNSNKHFGNPFSSDDRLVEKDNLIKTNSTRESVEKYIDWVLNSNEERAIWIREQILSGNLNNRPIVYYKELDEPSHATALDYLINQYNLELSDNISTFANPFATEEGVEIPEDDYKAFIDYQREIDQSISDEESLNDLDNDVDNFKDDDDMPIC